jgi:hypothetical protein
MPFLGEVDFSSGGHYQLSIEFGACSAPHVRTALQALWAQPALDGCYLRADLPRARQQRLSAEHADVRNWLYGEARLPDGHVVPCGTYAFAPPKPDADAGDAFLSFNVPIGGLAGAYPDVGAFPFDQQSSRPWREPLEAWLASLGRDLFARAPFKLALIGFEVGDSSSHLTNGRVPDQRWIGCLMPGASGLAYSGTNRWDAPFSFEGR